MMRGSSFLLEKSLRNYRALINAISKMSPQMWTIDIDTYDDASIGLLLDCKQQIIEALGKDNRPSDTLITKIMLGVFANIPAYDQYFRRSFKIHALNKKSLLTIEHFYATTKKNWIPSKNILLTFNISRNRPPLSKSKIDRYLWIHGWTLTTNCSDPVTRKYKNRPMD